MEFDGLREFEESRVPVAGGELAVLRWPATRPDAPTVLALHGITANGLSWGRVAHELAGRVNLIAPDLRGRGASNEIQGPYGIAAHADDVPAVLDAFGLDQVVLTGHSMGAFVAALAAVRHPSRIASLLLLDGGVGFPLPAELAGDELITAVIGPAMRRLSMTFSDWPAYQAFWEAHPAFAGAASPWVDAYLRRDLVGREPDLHSSCRLDAVRTDGLDLFEPHVLQAVHQLTCPADLLWAERGLMDEPQGLYDDHRLTASGLPHTQVKPLRLDDTNHYTILVGAHGARTIAEHLVRAVDAAPAV